MIGVLWVSLVYKYVVPRMWNNGIIPKASPGNDIYTPHEGFNSHTLETH